MNSPERSKNQYKYVQVPDASRRKGFRTEAKYIGPLYAWCMRPQELRKVRLTLAAAETFGLVLFFTGVLIRNQTNRSSVVGVLSGITLITWLFELLAAGFFCFMKPPLKEGDYHYIHSILSRSFWIRLICMAAAFILSLTVMILTGRVLAELLTAVCFLSVALLSYGLTMLRKGILDTLEVTEPSDEE